MIKWPWTGKIERSVAPPTFSQEEVMPLAFKSISQRTIALMIRGFQRLCFESHHYWDGSPLMEVDKLSITLFGMGFDQPFLDRCSQRYRWNFASLFPALHDGSFFPTDQLIERSTAIDNGRAMLRGFATALSGIIAQNPEFAIEAAQEFQNSLLNDGFQFVGTRLIETNQDIIPESQEISAVESLIRRSIHDNREILLHHFGNGRNLYESGPYHACINEWRSFLEETLRGVWRATRINRPDFSSFAERPSVKDPFSFLNRSGFLKDDEKEAFNGAWAFLSAGGHPGISDRDDAHLSMILTLTFGHAALLKLEKWADNSCSHL